MKKPRFKAKVSVYVIFIRDNQLLMLRRSQTGICDGEYGIPMGGVEKNETVVEAAIREAREEVGLHLNPEDLEFTHVMYRLNSEDRGVNPDDWMVENTDFYFTCREFKGEPLNAEPHKHDDVRFFDIKDLPSNVMKHLRVGLDQIFAGNVFSQYGWHLREQIEAA